MTREEYLEKRKELMVNAQNFINASNLDEFNKTKDEIAKLDSDFESEAQAQAELDALNNIVNVTNVQNVNNVIDATNIVDSTNMDTNIVNVLSSDAKAKMEEDLYVNAWAKDMMNKPLNEQEQAIFDAKNLAFTHTTENTGVLIPDTVVQGIWKEIGEQYPLFDSTFKTNVKGTLSLLKSESSTDAEWYEEDVETSDGKETFTKATLNGCELSRAITISWKLKEMAVKEFVAHIQTMLSEKIGKALAYGVYKGKGVAANGVEDADEPLGIKTTLMAEEGTPQVIKYDSSNPINYVTFTKLMSLVKSGYKKGAAIYADNQTIWNTLATIVDANGRPYFVADVTSGGVGRILGITVKEDDSIDTGDILLANANKGYHVNINKQIILDSEEHKKARKTTYIAYGIVDGAVRTSNAFALITPTPSVRQDEEIE